jgi:2,3-bisphosphoglycerate-dependent phosphoglycerate mutase
MTHLYLIRHGDSIDGLEDGQYRDLGLSPEGIRQAERLRDRLAGTGEIKPDVFISSPERRAHETARILAPAVGQPIVLDEDVEEWRSEDGSLSSEEFMRRWEQTPSSQRLFQHWVEGGESWVEFSARVQTAFNRILREHAGKTILLLTHGGDIQVAFFYFFGFGLANFRRSTMVVNKTSITHWFQQEEEDRWILERFNDYHHLAHPS